MEFFRKDSDDFFRGPGAEFAFKTSDGVSIVSGGRILKVRMETAEGDTPTSRIVLIDADQVRHVIFEGPALAAAAKLVEIGRMASNPRTPINVSRRGLYVGLAVFTAVYLVFCHPARQSDDLATISAANELGSLLKDIPAVARGGAPGINMPGGITPPVPGGLQMPQAASTVLDKPAFLSLPEDAQTDTASIEPGKDSAEVPAFPSYSPDLYDGTEKSAATPAINAEPAKASVEASAPATEASQPDDKVEPAHVTKVDTPAKTGAIEKAPLPEDAAPPAVAPAKDAPDEAAAAAPLDAKQVVTNATKDMTVADTAAVLKQIEQMMAMDPSTITPDMLSKLPHDIASALRDTGVLDNPAAMPEKGDAPYAAIRLPADVLDKFRGKDGIASIPENDTYAALGNRIPLQLPGGGDIRKPEDLRLFGFEP